MSRHNELSRRVGPRVSRAGRKGVNGRTFAPHPATAVYDEVQMVTGFSRQKLHGFTSYEYAPTQSADCFLLWLAWRCQRKKDTSVLCKLVRKYKSRLRAIGLDRAHCRRLGKRSYWRNVERNRAKARLTKSRKVATPIGAIEISLRRRLYGLVRCGEAVKNESALTLIGCSLEFLKTWLENRFVVGMSWDNYGSWHIDHKRPCATFDLLDQEQQSTCFHFSNLQPLWAQDNLSKGAKWTR